MRCVIWTWLRTEPSFRLFTFSVETHKWRFAFFDPKRNIFEMFVYDSQLATRGSNSHAHARYHFYAYTIHTCMHRYIYPCPNPPAQMYCRQSFVCFFSVDLLVVSVYFVSYFFLSSSFVCARCGARSVANGDGWNGQNTKMVFSFGTDGPMICSERSSNGSGWQVRPGASIRIFLFTWLTDVGHQYSECACACACACHWHSRTHGNRKKDEEKCRTFRVCVCVMASEHDACMRHEPFSGSKNANQ